MNYSVIVSDTSPLITLALGEAIELLEVLGLPIIIPDAVYTEATRVEGAPGATRIVEWVANSKLVKIAVTETGVDQQRRIMEGRPIRDMGENAAFEELARLLTVDASAAAVLLFEDAHVAGKRASLDRRIELMTTGDFLRELETAGFIISAEAVLNTAALRGRNVEKQRKSIPRYPV